MPDPQKPFRFLQFSDALFDSARGAKTLELSPTQRRDRNEEGLVALEDLLAAANQKELDAVICAGNLFDSDTVTSATVERLQKAFGRMRCPVVIAPGQFDPWSESSMYNRKLLETRGFGRWSENVHILSGSGYSVVRLPSRPDVSVTGRANTGGTDLLDLTPVPSSKDDPARVRVLVSQIAGLSGIAPESLYIDKTASSGFHYTVFSGYHGHLVIRNEHDKVVGAFSGTFLAQTEFEQGPRRALYCEISPEECKVEATDADRRRLYVCAVDFTGVQPDQYLSRVEDSLKSSTARSRDMVILKLFGPYVSDAPVALRPADLSQRYYHVKIEDKTRPDFGHTTPDTVESRFITLVDELRARFRTSGTMQDEGLSEEIIEDALYFGLSALREGKVTVRDAD